jgi:DNA-binding MarR family transcriptional regulator
MSDQDPFNKALRDWVEETMHRSIHAFLRYSRKSALSLSQTNSLFRLYHHGPSPVNDLADHLGITMAAVSQLLAPLEEINLIQRSQDTSDRRVKQIVLTDQGIQRVKEMMNARHAWLDELASALTPDQKQIILPALTLLKNASSNLPHRIDH